MKTDTVNQEILLVTTTTFANKEWCEKNAQEGTHQSPIEHLEEACWNGLLDELLPEIIEKSVFGKSLSMWQIRQCKSFLEIELGEYPVSIENYFSLDPYSFLPMMVYS